MGRKAENQDHVKARNGRTNASQKKGVSVPASFPKMPKTLPKAAQVYWHMYCELYTTTNILTCFDGAILGILCDDLAQRDLYIRERDDLEDTSTGTIYMTTNGAFAMHPVVKMIINLNSDIKASCRVLGLDPLNRSNIKPAENKDKSGGGRVGMRRK